MPEDQLPDWTKKLVTPERVLEEVKPGMSIFLGTGAAEPRTLVRHLIASPLENLKDLELLQLISLSDAVTSHKRSPAGRFRLKTFFSGWLASDAVTSGSIDLIPSRISRIPRLLESGAIRVDAAFVQITPPDASGYASLGVSVDAAKYAMEKATLVVGEINDQVPRTMGNTFVHVDQFHYLVKATEPPLYFPRWPVNDALDRVAANVAAMIEDGSCISFYNGPLFEALGRHLMQKRNLGVHTFFFTDPLMDLVRCGAVNNRMKGYFRGKSLTSYAQGSRELMQWLDRNPLVEFQGIDIVSERRRISMNEKMIVVIPARKVDLTGNIALQIGRGNVTGSPGQAQEFFAGAEYSPGGRTIIALPSRNLRGEANILVSVAEFPNQFTNRESLDLIVTDYGIASLAGRTIRERAQSLIDIAHPDDRAALVAEAKRANILYADQIYLKEAAALYPEYLTVEHTFQDGLRIRFRAIKPSDEEEMRRLFYRFSDRAVYYRYFSPIQTMPHEEMQEYVNVDYRRVMSIVGTVEEEGMERIIAEGRYTRRRENTYPNTAFVVDERYQGRGIATLLLELLIRTAREQGLGGFSAAILADNKAMLRVFEKTGRPLQAAMIAGVYHLKMSFADDKSRV